MGRVNTTFNEKQLAEFTALSAYLTLEQLADYFGIATRTISNMRLRDKDLDAIYREGKAKGVAKVARSLMKNCLKGNVSAQTFYLKTQAGWKESTDLNIEVTQRNHAISFITPPEVIEHIE